MEHYVAGRSIVITGGSSGFGLEAARLLLDMGAQVTITGRDAERLARAEADLGAADLGSGDNLLCVPADARSTADWQRLLATVTERFGGLDVLVCNHGAGVKIAPVEQMSDDEIATVLDINIGSVIKGCREAIGVMKPAGRGHIVTVASACARHSWANWSVYTAAKAGLVGYTKCLHLEMAEWGGKATCFIPGAARTGFCDAAGLDDSWQAGYPGAEEFARTLVHTIDVPDNCVIETVSIWGTEQVKGFSPF